MVFYFFNDESSLTAIKVGVEMNGLERNTASATALKITRYFLKVNHH